MPLKASYIDEEGRLDLCFWGNLDLSVSQQVCDIYRRVGTDLRSCIIDLSDVERVFDSGVALLQMLHRRLDDLGITVVILSDHPEIWEPFPYVARKPLHMEARARA